MSETKRCPGCGETKRREGFGRDSSKKDGLYTYCRLCRRRYRKKNREAIREKKRRYHEKNREAILERQRRYREENREAILEGKRRYREENREAINERQRRYREENRAYINRQARKWLKDSIKSQGRSGRFSPSEDQIVMRDDLSLTEMACLLRRSYTSVSHRRMRLRAKGILT